MATALINRKKHKITNRKRDYFFYFGLMAIPLAQFVVFYIMVNINSILLVFQEFKNPDFVFLSQGHLFDNFKSLFTGSDSTLLTAFRNSILIWAIGVLVGTPLGLFFSFYIYKRRKAANFFKFCLFLPSIIPGILLTTIFKKFANDFLTKLLNNVFHADLEFVLLESASKFSFPLIIIFGIWISFGTSVLLYTNAMNQIPKNIIESCELDGCSPFRQMISIVIPMILPTIETFMVSSVAGLFMNQALLFNFFGYADTYANMHYSTIGFLIFRQAAPGSESNYPTLATLGILCSLIAIPSVYLIKRLFKRLER